MQKNSASPVASQPLVTYMNGKLTIKASNASLAECLRAISAQTGIVIDFPAGSGGDRIYLREGPGTVRQVLANLLNGSDFNYVILGSPDSPDKLTRVVLARAGQATDFSPAASEKKKDSEEQAKTIRDTLLWTPPTGSGLWTPPKEDSAATVSARTLNGESLQAPAEPLPPEVLEQMMKERTQKLHEQAQQPQ